MKTMIIAAAVAALTGCASNSDNWSWQKPGGSEQAYYMDNGQCRAQAFSVASGNLMQIALVYDGCMQGKGWYKTSTRVARAEPSPVAPQTKGCELTKTMDLICP